MPVLCINYMKPVHINKHVVPTLCCYYTSMIEPWHADCRSLATSKLHHNFFLINFSHLRIHLPLGSYRVLQDICNLLQKITCMNNQQTIFQTQLGLDVIYSHVLGLFLRTWANLMLVTHTMLISSCFHSGITETVGKTIYCYQLAYIIHNVLKKVKPHTRK